MSAVVDESTVREVLRGVMDPELGHDIVHLGLLREIEVEGDSVWVNVVPTSANCPFAKQLQASIHAAVSGISGVKSVHVEWGSET